VSGVHRRGLLTLAPWDGFPAAGSPAKPIDAAVDAGIASTVAMREAVGPAAQIMVDCHSFFDVTRPERFVNGTIAVSDRAGLGFVLNDAAIRRHALSL